MGGGGNYRIAFDKASTDIFLQERLNFGGGWIRLFFDHFSASDVLTDVLTRKSNKRQITRVQNKLLNIEIK